MCGPSRSSSSAGAPQEQQVVEIDLAPRPFTGDVRFEQGGNGLGMSFAPGKVRRQHLTEAMSGVDAPRVHLDKSGRARHADVSCIEAVLVSQQVHHVGGVRWIEKREPRLQPERLCTAADELVRDGVKGAPAQTSPPLPVAAQGGRSREHVVCRAPREGQQQDSLRCHPSLEQSGHPRGQRARLAGAGTGHDHERVVSVDDRRQLCLVKVCIPARLGVHVFDTSARPVQDENHLQGRPGNYLRVIRGDASRMMPRCR